MRKKWIRLKIECPIDITEEVKIAKDVEQDLIQLDWYPNYDYALKNLLRAKNNLQVLITNLFHLIKIYQPRNVEKPEDKPEEFEEQVKKIIDDEDEEDEEGITEDDEGKEENFARILKILDRKENDMTSVSGGAVRIKASDPKAVAFKEEVQAILKIIYHSLRKSTNLHPKDAKKFSQHLNESLQDKFSLIGAEVRDKKGIDLGGRKGRKKKK